MLVRRNGRGVDTVDFVLVELTWTAGCSSASSTRMRGGAALGVDDEHPGEQVAGAGGQLRLRVLAAVGREELRERVAAGSPRSSARTGADAA